MCYPALGVGRDTVLALARVSGSPLLAAVSWGYVWLFRSIPLLVLGLPRGRQIRRMILRQAMRSILPAAFNDVIGLSKSTSVV